MSVEGKIFAFDGSLLSMWRGKAYEQIDGLGGDTSFFLSEADYLVDGSIKRLEPRLTKLEQAEKLRAQGHPIRIVSESTFLRMIGWVGVQTPVPVELPPLEDG